MTLGVSPAQLLLRAATQTTEPYRCTQRDLIFEGQGSGDCVAIYRGE